MEHRIRERARLPLLVSSLLLAALTAAPVAQADTETTSDVPTVSFTFLAADGTPLSGAAVIIYQWPFDPPASFVPQVLALGAADDSGVFSTQLDRRATGVRGPWGDGDATLVNAIVKAIDPTNRWLVRYDAVLPLDASYSDTLVANADLAVAWPRSRAERTRMTGKDVLEIGRIELVHKNVPCRNRDRCPRPTSIVAETTRQVKVLEMHASAGMHAVFTYSTGQATKGTTAVKVGANAWGVGGMILEETSRGASASVAKDGGYHQLRYANYRFYEYAEQPAGGGTTTWTWRINHWTGGLSQTATVTEPAFNAQYAEVLTNAGASRYQGQNKTFTSSFTLQGLSHSSKAQYYSNTRMDWSKISGCSGIRYLYGQGADWPVAPTVYARCV